MTNRTDSLSCTQVHINTRIVNTRHDVMEVREGARATHGEPVRAEYQLGAGAERALTLALEAELPTEQQNEMSESGESGSAFNENDSPSG
jgi:hypothetical protein